MSKSTFWSKHKNILILMDELDKSNKELFYKDERWKKWFLSLISNLTIF